MRYIKKAKRNEALLFPEYLDDRYDLWSTFCLQNWRLMLKYTPMTTQLDRRKAIGKPLVYMQMEMELDTRSQNQDNHVD